LPLPDERKPANPVSEDSRDANRNLLSPCRATSDVEDRPSADQNASPRGRSTRAVCCAVWQPLASGANRHRNRDKAARRGISVQPNQSQVVAAGMAAMRCLIGVTSTRSFAKLAMAAASYQLPHRRPRRDLTLGALSIHRAAIASRAERRVREELGGSRRSGKKAKRAGKPGSVGSDHFSRTTIARRLKQPTRTSNGPDRSVRRSEERRFALLGLAPGGVYRAEPVTRPAGALLPHRFTLTTHRQSRKSAGRSAVCFLWHFPWLRSRWALPTTLSCGARTFLGTPTSRSPAITWPAPQR